MRLYRQICQIRFYPKSIIDFYYFPDGSGSVLLIEYGLISQLCIHPIPGLAAAKNKRFLQSSVTTINERDIEPGG